jgi:hypothetical protein
MRELANGQLLRLAERGSGSSAKGLLDFALSGCTMSIVQSIVQP